MLGTIPATGFLEVQVTLPGTIDPGKEYPVQAIIGPFTNPNSKLTNLLLL